MACEKGPASYMKFIICFGKVWNCRWYARLTRGLFSRSARSVPEVQKLGKT